MEKLLKRTCMCGTLRAENIGETVCVNGWVAKKRNLGGLIFADIRDKTGIVQVVFNDQIPAELFAKADKLRSEFVVGVKGKVCERESKNSTIPTGDIEIIVEDFSIYSEADTPPIYIRDDDNASEDVRLKYRYLDLRKPAMQRNLSFRHRLCKIARDFYDENGFTEVETPVLCKATPEGARDYLVPSRVNHGKFYALPQSPQIFKQLLMIGGTDRYMQIAKCFRDEDLRADRQPEFTQIDLEMSFVDQDDVIDVQERFLCRVFKELMGVEIPRPFKRLSWDEAMNRYGSDKPDLRVGFELHDIADIVKDCGFSVFTDAIASGGRVMGINMNGYGKDFSRKDVDKMTESIKTFGAKGLITVRVEENEVKCSAGKFLTEEEIGGIVREFDGKPGDLILIVAGKQNVVWDSLGFLRRDLAGKLGLLKADDFKLLWVIDFPMFEWSDEEGRYMAMHHPFTSPKPEHIHYLDSGELDKILANAYDIVFNGIELGGGSIRIHDRGLQRKIFEALKLTDEEIKTKFGFFLEAFNYGTPPHGGLAYGLDRFCMLLAGAGSIREVMAFPKNAQAQDVMADCPTPVTQDQLDELAIAVVDEE